MRRLFQNKTVLVIVNAIFWLGLAALLLTHPVRLAVGAGLLALLGGGYMLYAGFFPRITRGLAYPGPVRVMAASLGLIITGLGLFWLLHVLQGGVPTPQQQQESAAQKRLLEASRGSTYLDLSGLGLDEVPPEVWGLEHLTWLELNDNRLASLPPEIGKLTNLKTLDLWGNRLTSLPPEIGKLEKLQELYLFGNRLTSLPPEIGDLQSLEWLNLSHNQLESLPPEFARLRRLTGLKLKHNRLTEFPSAILELENLEVLFVSGNQMGDLPPSITQRAEAGTLNLAYDPNASSFDGASVFVVGVTFVLPLLMSWGLNRWWTARERAQRQAARREGEVFAIPPFLRGFTLLVVFVLSAVSLLMLASGINEARTNVTLETGLGLTLLFSPIILGGLFFLWYNSGLVVLTPEGVRLQRPGRGHFLPYGGITALQSRTNPFVAALLIWGAGRTLRIPRTLENLPRLYELLLSRVAPAVRQAALGPAVEPLAGSAATAKMDGPIYSLRVSRRVWGLYIAGTGFLVLLYLGLGLMGLWLGLIRGDVPPFTTEWLTSTAIFFSLVSALFLPALFFVLRGLLTRYGPFGIEQPVAWEFYRDEIRYRFPRGPWQARAACDLQRVTLEPLSFTVRARIGIRQRLTRYMLVLEFVGSDRLVIDQERAAQFGQSPERLRAMIERLYRAEASADG